MLNLLSSSFLSRLFPQTANSIIRGNANDTIIAGKFVDFIDAGGGNNTVIQLVGNARIIAGAGNDTIKTGLGNSKIDAGDGDNTVISLAGNNEIKAGSGHDTIYAGCGDDVIDAGDGNNFVSAGAGDNKVSTGSGNDKIYTLCGDDIISSGAGDDYISSGSGNDRVDAGAGNDYVDAGNGNDIVYGGLGNDVIDGGCGNDILYGDAPFIGETVSVDFQVATNWTANLSESGTQIRIEGATLTAAGGVFSPNGGLGILSPSDATSGFGFPKEIDAWNDTPESVRIDFDEAQSKVGFTLNRFFIEKLIIVEPELADLTIRFSDGSSATQLLKGTTSGLLDVSLDSNDFGGRQIVGIELAPNPKLWEILKPTRPTDYNPNHPFSEFTLAALSFEKDANATGPNNDKLYGGHGNDVLDGGWGNDKLYGEAGDDILKGGQGDNYLCGGSGRDTFVFDKRSTGNDVVADFSLKHDKLQFDDGVSVVSSARDHADLVLTLSTGGTVTLNQLGHVSDWSLLV